MWCGHCARAPPTETWSKARLSVSEGSDSDAPVWAISVGPGSSQRSARCCGSTLDRFLPLSAPADEKTSNPMVVLPTTQLAPRAHPSPELPTHRLGRYPWMMSLQAPTLPDLRQDVHDAARRARVAARVLSTLPTVAKDRALHAAADALLSQAHVVLAANAEDLDAARAAGTSEALLDRLALSPHRVDGIAAGL